MKIIIKIKTGLRTPEELKELSLYVQRTLNLNILDVMIESELEC